MHSGSLKRWEHRRDQEWKLNYAIWTALVALIAGYILAVKDVNVATPPDWAVYVVSSAFFVAHACYLWPMTSRGISEIQMQADAESAINDMLTRKLDEKNFGGGIASHWAIEKRYGLVAPLAITALLLIVGGWVLLHPPTRIVDDQPKQLNLNPAPPITQQPAEPAPGAVKGVTRKRK